MDLVSTNSGEFQQLPLSGHFHNGYIVDFIQGVTWGLEFSQLEIPHTDIAFSKIASRNDELAIVAEPHRLDASGVELQLSLNGKVSGKDIDICGIIFFCLLDGGRGEVWPLGGLPELYLLLPVGVELGRADQFFIIFGQGKWG